MLSDALRTAKRISHALSRRISKFRPPSLAHDAHLQLQTHRRILFLRFMHVHPNNMSSSDISRQQNHNGNEPLILVSTIQMICGSVEVSGS